MTPRLERAIGVVYKPEIERASHYFHARLPEQFDAVIHVDATSALAPLERWSRHEEDLPETYPTGV
jgi:erythromycin esterase-like protein